MFTPLRADRANTIFVPSGDQPGWRQSIEPRSEKAPPHPGIASWCRPLPSEFTAQIELRWLGSAWAANRIVFPLGDQLTGISSLSGSARLIPGGVIWVQ